MPIRKSITPDFLICLEDGRKFKSLKRHLRTKYDMSPEEYRAKWGLAKDYPMVAPNYAKARSDLAKQMGLGQGGRKPARAAAAPRSSLRTFEDQDARFRKEAGVLLSGGGAVAAAHAPEAQGPQGCVALSVRHTAWRSVPALPMALSSPPRMTTAKVRNRARSRSAALQMTARASSSFRSTIWLAVWKSMSASWARAIRKEVFDAGTQEAGQHRRASAGWRR